jgi:hypothetical protein
MAHVRYPPALDRPQTDVLPVGAALEAVMTELERDRWSMKVRAGD